jgi:hypothetical protein
MAVPCTLSPPIDARVISLSFPRKSPRFTGRTKPRGSTRIVKHSPPPSRELTLREIAAWALPRRGLDEGVAAWRFRNLPNFARGFYRVAFARLFRIPTHYGAVYLTKICGDGSRVVYGLASMRVVTDAGVAAIVDAFQNTVELETFKYHGFGTGTTAEAAGDTALVTELTTEYNPNSTRPTGSQGEGATANIYRTVGTLTPDSGGTIAVTEHGVFTQAATGGGTLLDRSKFAAVNLDSTNGDSLAATYDLTLTSGG